MPNSSSAEQYQQIVALAYQSFANKFDYIFPTPQIARAVLNNTINANNALIRYHDNQVAGILGYFHEGHGFFNFSPPKIERLLNSDISQSVIDRLQLLNNTIPRNTFYIEAVAVDPNMRKKGIASDLIQHAQYLARQWHYQFVALDVTNTNISAMSLYHKHGFKVVSARAVERDVLDFQYFNRMICPLN